MPATREPKFTLAPSQVGGRPTGVITRVEDIHIDLTFTYEQFKANEANIREVFYMTNFDNLKPGDVVEAWWRFEQLYLNGVDIRFSKLMLILSGIPVSQASMREMKTGIILMEQLLLKFRAVERMFSKAPPTGDQ